MAEMFKTCLGIAGKWSGDEWENQRAKTYEKYRSLAKDLPLAQKNAIRDWGSDHLRSDHQRILSPAGYWCSIPLDEQETCFVRCRQVEIARYGFPDLYEAKLSMLDESNERLGDISDLVPVNSIDEALDRFRSALNSDFSNTLVAALQDSIAVRVFGVAASPACFSSVLKISVPTLAELQEAVSRLLAAAVPLRDVIESLQGTDAFNHICHNARTEEGRNVRLERLPIAELCDALNRFAKQHGPLEKRPGRRVKGGKENALVLTLSMLWQMCQLGEPKYAQQSRFIRACAVVLPWHGVHKADVAQFVRGEMKKVRTRSSRGGYVING